MKKVKVVVQTWMAHDFGNDRDETWYALYLDGQKVAEGAKLGKVTFDMKVEDLRK